MGTINFTLCFFFSLILYALLLTDLHDIFLSATFARAGNKKKKKKKNPYFINYAQPSAECCIYYY